MAVYAVTDHAVVVVYALAVFSQTLRVRHAHFSCPPDDRHEMIGGISLR